MRTFPRFAAVMFALSLSAVAQTKVCIGGDLDGLSPAQIASCQQKSAGLQAEAAHMGVPEGWHVIVVCDEAGWSDYASFSGKTVAAVMETSQQTDLNIRTVFVRGSRMGTADTRGIHEVLASAMEQMPATARPAVAHPRPQSTGELRAAVEAQDSPLLKR